MTIRVLRCDKFPRLIDNKYQVEKIEKKQFNVKINPVFQDGNVSVTSLKFMVNEIEVIDW